MSRLMYRYESITSELKVWAERSPLSEWTDTTIVKKLRFQILFNQSNNQSNNQKRPQIIRGNQNHLQSLVSVIAGYVDDLLTFQVSSQSSSQDFEIKLFHRLFIPNFQGFSRLEFSTLELFDLFTNLELLTSELEILPTFDAALHPFNTSLKLVMPRWWQIAAIAIATVGITTATRFLFPPEYSPQSIATLNSSENSLKSTTEQKPEQKSPNNSRNLSQPKTIIPTSPRPAKSDRRTLPETYAGRISPIKPQTPANTNISPLPKLAQKSQLKSVPKSASPDDFANLSQPKVLKPSPNLPKNESLIPPVKAPRSDQLFQNLPVIPLPIKPSISADQPPENSFGSTDSNQITPKTPIERQKANRSRVEVTPLTSSQIFRGDSDRSNLKDGTIKGKNPKIAVTKIDGSPNSQDLQTYKQKIESWEYQKSPEETNIELRWQNRQIVELKIQPENPQLTELIRRSLFETFSDQDGNIQISLNVTVP